jgi:hypothetical protein
MDHPLWREGGYVSYEYACPFVKRTYRIYSMLLKILSQKQLKVRVRVEVTSQLAAYRQSVRLDAKTLETHDQRRFPESF